MPKYPLAKYITACDWLILEEPEHLNWLHPFNHYHRKAAWVTGILHTNYIYYLKHHVPVSTWLKTVFNHYSRWLVQWHCDDVIRLGDNLPTFKHGQLLDVNGVHPAFFAIIPPENYQYNAYFMGKLVWEKGWQELIDLLAQSSLRELDVFGNGDDKANIDAYAQRQGIRLRHHGVSHNPASDLRDYKIFINPSRSEVVCTTTAEALAQGRFVIIPNDISNQRFQGYKNCLYYDSLQAFLRQLQFAMENMPQIDPKVHHLSFDAATERLLSFHNSQKLGH